MTLLRFLSTASTTATGTGTDTGKTSSSTTTASSTATDTSEMSSSTTTTTTATTGTETDTAETSSSTTASSSSTTTASSSTTTTTSTTGECRIETGITCVGKSVFDCDDLGAPEGICSGPDEIVSLRFIYTTTICPDGNGNAQVMFECKDRKPLPSGGVNILCADNMGLYDLPTICLSR